VPAEGNAAGEFFCSDVSCLIAAMNDAQTTGGATTINLDPGSYTLTSIDNVPQSGIGANGLPLVISEITINAADAATTIIERDSGAPFFRIFDVAANGSLTLKGLTVRGGVDIGGGILNFGVLNVSDSIITENHGRSDGGGIFNLGRLNLTRSFVILNSASLEGAGILNSGTAVVLDSSISENFRASGAGGISNSGTMTVQNSTINDNTADAAGGVLNSGVMDITNTTLANNGAGFVGGGVVTSSGTLKITDSTISGNFAIALFSFPSTGGGILNRAGGLLEIQNTIVALNTVTATAIPFSIQGPDCSGTITSLGNNIIGDLTGCDISLAVGDLVTDPGLGDFVDDETPGGGHFPLLVSSPAINRGNDDVCSADPVLSTDQLGQSRVGPCDIGAVEFEAALTIGIDVRPQRDPNRINPNSTRNINVALLSAAGFDATLIDPNTVRFGAAGVEAAPIHTRRRDVNGDGQRDLVLRFQIPDLGIECGASSLTLTAQNPAGHPITGSSAIITTGCRQ
jgi:hypothetical protein